MSEKKKAEMIFKTFRTVVIKTGEEEGVIDILIPMSTGSIDRHNESIDPKGWKKHLKAFKKRAIMISSHNYQGLQNQIGEFLDLQVVEKGLLARPKYYINQGNPEADWGYFLATKGKAAFSVGFIPIKWVDSKDKPTRTYLEQELIEISHVIVPSNRDAIMSLKSESGLDPVIKEVIDEVIKDKDFFMKEAELTEEGKKKMEAALKDIAEGRIEKVDLNELYLEKEVMTKPEETDESIRLPVKGEEGKHKGHKIRWITVSTKEGIRGIYCVDDKKIITYVFAKDKGWTMVKAKKWMEDNGKMISNYFLNIDPDTFKDLETEEVDWGEVKASIEKDEKEEGLNTNQIKECFPELNEKGFTFIWDLITERNESQEENKELIKKLKDLELKAGAVLNAKLEKDLKAALTLIQSVLDSTEKEEGQEGEEGKDSKKGDTVITIIDDKKEDPGKDEKKDKNLIEVDEKVIAEIIEKKMNYIVGKTDK